MKKTPPPSAFVLLLQSVFPAAARPPSPIFLFFFYLNRLAGRTLSPLLQALNHTPDRRELLLSPQPPPPISNPQASNIVSFPISDRNRRRLQLLPHARLHPQLRSSDLPSVHSLTADPFSSRELQLRHGGHRFTDQPGTSPPIHRRPLNTAAPPSCRPP